MQKSRQKIKITHNPTTQNNYIDVVKPVDFFFLPVHMYISEYKTLHLYPFVVRNSLASPLILCLVFTPRILGLQTVDYNKGLRAVRNMSAPCWAFGGWDRHLPAGRGSARGQPQVLDGPWLVSCCGS